MFIFNLIFIYQRYFHSIELSFELLCSAYDRYLTLKYLFLDHSLIMEITEERENFIKLSYIIVEVVAKHLRALFIKKWNNKYPSQQWNSDAASGIFLYNILPIGFRSSTGNTVYVDKMKTGKEEEWDTTTLVKVMLNSGLNLVQGCRPVNQRSIPLRPSEEIEVIRNYRNGSFAHLPMMLCKSNEFKQAVADIKSAAKGLFGVDVEKEICEVENCSIDKTIIEKLVKLIKMETDLKQNVDEMVKKLNGKLS